MQARYAEMIIFALIGVSMFTVTLPGEEGAGALPPALGLSLWTILLCSQLPEDPGLDLGGPYVRT